MRPAVVPVAQAVTAAVELFTVLSACGYPSAYGPRRPSVARPGAPVVALDGVWDGTIEPPPEPRLGVHVVIVSQGQVPLATMNHGQDIYAPSPSPASRHSGTDFVLHLRRGDRLVTLAGRITLDGKYMGGIMTGFSPNPRRFILYRTR